MPWIAERAAEISWDRLQTLMEQTVAEARRRICARPKRVLLLPPDITRMHSGAGRLTEMLYNLLAGEADVHVIPTLGQHVPHTPEENRQMFGSIPNERIHAHDWRGGCVEVGEIPGRFVDEATQGAADWPMPIVLNRMLMEEPWDLIINVGHVVPHEVLGFRQPQQELLHRPGRQGPHLRGAHGGRLLRHRKQPGQPDHAGAGVLQPGRRRVPGPAARSVRAGGARAQRARPARAHRRLRRRRFGNVSGGRPAIARAEHHAVRRADAEDRVRHAGRRVLQHVGGEQDRSIARGWRWPTAASWSSSRRA